MNPDRTIECLTIDTKPVPFLFGDLIAPHQFYKTIISSLDGGNHLMKHLPSIDIA